MTGQINAIKSLIQQQLRGRHPVRARLIEAMCDRHFFAEGKNVTVVNLRRFGFASTALSAGEE
jgi:hypothetical protein